MLLAPDNFSEPFFLADQSSQRAGLRALFLAYKKIIGNILMCCSQVAVLCQMPITLLDQIHAATHHTTKT